MAAVAVGIDREIVLLNPHRYQGIPRESLTEWLGALVAEIAPQATSLTARLVSDRVMRSLNFRFRQIDRPTDVLSFPGEATREGLHLGDLAISVPAARRQAADLGHSLARELECLLLHGVLHCLGHDHETDDGAMDRLERRLRARWVGRTIGGAGS